MSGEQALPKGRVLAVCTSERKGTRKRDVREAELRPDWGIVGDAHAADLQMALGRPSSLYTDLLPLLLLGRSMRHMLRTWP